MDFEPLSENLEWEMRRIATAFGLQECGSDMYMHDDSYTFTFYGKGGFRLEVVTKDNRIDQIYLDEEGCCELGKDPHTQKWSADSDTQPMADRMARALLCLGFDNEDVFAGLKSTVTGHEKIELRLLLPREVGCMEGLARIDCSGY